MKKISIFFLFLKVVSMQRPACRKDIIDMILSRRPLRSEVSELSSLYPLHAAITQRDTRKLEQLLVSRQHDIHQLDSNGRTPLHMAAEINAPECAELLLKYGANAHAAFTNILMAYTPMHVAAISSAVEVAEVILKYNPSCVNDVTVLGQTPLHIAAFNGSFRFVVLLVNKYKAPLHAVDGELNTPLHIAVQRSNGHDQLSIVELFIKECPETINCQTNTQKTPLFLAVKNGNPRICSFLLESGADPTIPDEHGEIPLHMTTQCNDIDSAMKIIDMLIKNNRSTLYIRSRAGKTVLESLWATQYPNARIKEILIRFFEEL